MHLLFQHFTDLILLVVLILVIVAVMHPLNKSELDEANQAPPEDKE